MSLYAATGSRDSPLREGQARVQSRALAAFAPSLRGKYVVKHVVKYVVKHVVKYVVKYGIKYVVKYVVKYVIKYVVK